MRIGVYAIKNKLNGKCYVGSSKNIKKRFYCHSSFLRRGNHHCAHLQNAYKANGPDAFSMSTVLLCDTREEAEEIEQAILDIWYDDLYNSSRRADHTHMTGRHHS